MPDNESLAKNPFSYQKSKGGVVRIYRSNRLAITLRHKETLRFLSKIETADETNSQLIMAKATGQYKFGDENDRRERTKEY